MASTTSFMVYTRPIALYSVPVSPSHPKPPLMLRLGHDVFLACISHYYSHDALPAIASDSPACNNYHLCLPLNSRNRSWLPYIYFFTDAICLLIFPNTHGLSILSFLHSLCIVIKFQEQPSFAPLTLSILSSLTQAYSISLSLHTRF